MNWCEWNDFFRDGAEVSSNKFVDFSADGVSALMGGSFEVSDDLPRACISKFKLPDDSSSFI